MCIYDFTYGNRSFAIKDDILSSVIDESGKFISRFTSERGAFFKDNGLAVFRKDKKYGLVDLDGNTIISNKLQELCCNFSEKMRESSCNRQWPSRAGNLRILYVQSARKRGMFRTTSSFFRLFME